MISVDDAGLGFGSRLTVNNSISVNGHALSTQEIGFDAAESMSEVDRETTRYLAAASQLDLGYARQVVRRIIGEPFLAVAPAAGADVVVVTRWALSALRRRAQRDGVLACVFIAGVAAAWFGQTWVPLAAVAGLAVPVIAFERWVRDETVIARQMLRDRFHMSDAPSSASSRIEKRLAVVAQQQNGNLVVFREGSAFVGSGRHLLDDHLVIDLQRGRRAENGEREQPIPFTNQELHEKLERALKGMEFPVVRVHQRLFVHGRHIPRDSQILLDEAGPPAASVPPSLISSGCVKPTPEARTYVCAEVCGWKGQLVVSLFARAMQARGFLQVEWDFRFLPPLHDIFLQIDRRYELPRTSQFINAVIPSVVWAVPALIASPIQFGRYAIVPLFDRARRVSQAYKIRNGYVFNYGSRRSIREVATGYTRPHYFLGQDGTTFALIAGHAMLRALGEFLDDHKIDMGEFEAKEKAFVNKLTNYNIGNVSAENVAMGNRSRASSRRSSILPVHQNEGGEVGDKYSVGNIEADNVVFGKKAHAKFTNASISVDAAYQSRTQVEALQELQKFIELLPAYSQAMKSPHEVQANALEAKAALKKKRLNRSRIQDLIASITAGVTGIAALATAFESVQAAISRLFT